MTAVWLPCAVEFPIFGVLALLKVNALLVCNFLGFLEKKFIKRNPKPKSGSCIAPKALKSRVKQSYSLGVKMRSSKVKTEI